MYGITKSVDGTCNRTQDDNKSLKINTANTQTCLSELDVTQRSDVISPMAEFTPRSTAKVPIGTGPAAPAQPAHEALVPADQDHFPVDENRVRAQKSMKKIKYYVRTFAVASLAYAVYHGFQTLFTIFPHVICVDYFSTDCATLRIDPSATEYTTYVFISITEAIFPAFVLVWYLTGSILYRTLPDRRMKLRVFSMLTIIQQLFMLKNFILSATASVSILSSLALRDNIVETYAREAILAIFWLHALLNLNLVSKLYGYDATRRRERRRIELERN